MAMDVMYLNCGFWPIADIRNRPKADLKLREVAPDISYFSHLRTALRAKYFLLKTLR